MISVDLIFFFSRLPSSQRAYRAVMNSMNQSWIEAADDKDFHKLLEDHKTELAAAPAVK